MSNKNNDIWLEAACENFEEAVSQGNYAVAKDIIADVLDVSPDVGRALASSLRNMPLSTFMVKSPYHGN